MTAALSFGAAPAAAKEPCWRALFVDWADGRIDKTYPVHCYREAIAHLQQDTLTYGDAADQINRALMAAMTKMRKDDQNITPSTPVPPGPGSSDGPNSGGGAGGHDESFWDQVSHAIGPTNADAVPLPLLILAGLAMLLLAAAAASLIAKRVQAKRARPATVPPPPDPRR